MNLTPTPQQKMDAAFDNYFELSRILQNDMNALLDGENESESWRRNFIRASAALIEGYAHCLREMCAVSFECVAPELSKKETEVLRPESSLDANERIKLTLRAAYKLFELQPAPNFGGSEWLKAQRVLGKRHLLMHPKIPADLVITDQLWSELRTDVTWLMEQLFSIFSLLQRKHGG
jgi:uncharacterized protein with von Willebrand factor type A (vWA) domain